MPTCKTCPAEVQAAERPCKRCSAPLVIATPHERSRKYCKACAPIVERERRAETQRRRRNLVKGEAAARGVSIETVLLDRRYGNV